MPLNSVDCCEIPPLGVIKWVIWRRYVAIRNIVSRNIDGPTDIVVPTGKLVVGVVVFQLVKFFFELGAKIVDGLLVFGTEIFDMV